MLYPQNNKHRIAISLNGLWDFSFVGLDYKPTHPLTNKTIIGVPSSYNDLFTTRKERDHFGYVVYEKYIDMPNLLDGTFRLRIGAAGHRASCYLDSAKVCEHLGGFLPLDFEIPKQYYSKRVRLTIVLDNRLDYQTLPVGEISKDGKKQIIHYDFFNYVGIHRNVYLYHLPTNPIDDIVIETKNNTMFYQIYTTAHDVSIKLKDPHGNIVAETTGHKGSITLDNPLFWDIGQGNLYTLIAETNTDSYEETFGFRDIEVKDAKLLLNGKPVYLKGFGMHEDHITIGKGSISGLNIRDFELLKWINANSFRTSHYPYAEEMYDLADRAGILVINEIPAVGLNFWSEQPVFSPTRVNKLSQENYIKQFDELIARDKNHPCIISYSLANEANTHEKDAYDFFKPLFDHARTKTKLPLMIVEWVDAIHNTVAQLADIIGVNRYIGWYVDFADLSIIPEKLKASLQGYYDKYKKPVIVTEFGVDTIAGLHSLPSVAFSEEFQIEFIKAYQDVFNQLDFIIGEHVWNFADFMTKQGIMRVDGNKKGVFTRDRQPKMIAHYLKSYWEKR